MPSKNQKKAKKAASAAAAAATDPTVPPENFQKIISDMCTDLSTTFPEYAHTWSSWTTAALAALEPEVCDQEVRKVFAHCLSVFPERFFDILYKNADIFLPESTVNTCFLPGVDFKSLFRCEGVSENSCTVMWNYLQLILFTVVGKLHDKSKFGDSKNLFEGIEEADLLEKLGETMKNMTDFFQHMGAGGAEGASPAAEGGAEEGTEGAKAKEDREEIPFSGIPGMPNMDDLHNHLKGLFDGKIGAMAKELAEEISGDLSSILGEDVSDIRSTQDVLQKLMKNPAKISGLIKTIGDKLKKKMSSGEVSQEDLMKEATEFMNRMKGMGGGMDAFKDMFKNMGMPMPKNARMDTNALERMTQKQSTHERLKQRMLQKKAVQAEAMLKQMQQQTAAASMPQAPPSAADLEALSRQLGLDLTDSVAPSTAAPVKSKKTKKR